MQRKTRFILEILKCSAICGWLLFSPVAKSQNVSFDAVKVAEIVSGAYWEQVAPSLPLFMSKLEADLRSGNVTSSASQVFVEELSRALNKDNFTRAYAQIVSVKLSTDEQRELLMFFNSNVGKKYLALTNTEASSVELIKPIARQACTAASAKLGVFDRGTLTKLCASMN